MTDKSDALSQTGQPSKTAVVLATYNGQRFLAQQLKSLMEQTCAPAELLITDDGSADATPEIARDFARTAPFPVHVHQNPARLGYAANFLSAVERTSQPLVAFCDQDDVWLPAKLVQCAAAFANPDVSLVIHNARVVDSALRVLSGNLLGIRRNRISRALSLDPFLNPLGFTMVFRRSLFSAIDWRQRPRNYMGDGSTPMGHDQWLYFLAHAFGRSVILARPLALHRQHGANTFGVVSPKPASLADSLETDRIAYCERRDSCLEYARLLALRADSMDPLLRPNCLAASGFYHRLSRRLDARAQLVTSGGMRKCSHILSLSLQGGYRSRCHGGLGLRALVKDSLRFLPGTGGL